ncbi:MAG: HNH endonuclease family protein [Actinobacteria bacterium]|nr:HNH endonuclease family protein [Actinomycetota bacterium]
MQRTDGARRRTAVLAWLAVGVLVTAAVVVALNWRTVTGWFAPGPPVPGNTMFTSSAKDIATARTQLAALVVVPRPGSVGGYSRARFGDAWTDTDRNGCNQRDDVLLRDLLKDRPYRVARQGRCDHDVRSGSWADPYTGTVVTLTDAKKQSEQVQIDHIVALSVAWRYGADAWTPARRLTFANDLRNLVAVDGATNKGKGNADASQWRPDRGAECGYAVRYVMVKAAYALPTDRQEKQALAAMLDTCG